MKNTETAGGWNVMARQWPGSEPVPCKRADGSVIVLGSEEEAQTLAKQYRDGVSPHGACQPHYFAQAIGGAK